ncbi:related to dis1-suppressing protein kinase dsk1 [Fusarium fujikuroi]|nr:related to dis1-suppressing protein kinase dsk1 [Fusarium fujikuroi]SCO49858.1 related to dis1-suppressing protein kinase dsk1 [Fusarium fujikuroi]SCV34767.1 related to dis1-suppressing protein kinase dsk1 [Fusarium fujikuroi]
MLGDGLKSPQPISFTETLNTSTDIALGVTIPIEVNDALNQRYHIVDKLGQGGYSTIWLARDQELSKYVAIKVGTADQVSKESDILLKLAENPTKQLSGHLITQVLDHFTLHGPNGTHSCIVTAPARCSVAEAIKTSRQISFQPDVARALAAQLIMATAYGHQAGFVHGDPYPVTRIDGQPITSPSVPKNVYTPNWLGKPSDEVLLPEARLLLSDFGTAFNPSQETRLLSYTHLQNRPPEAVLDSTKPLTFSSDIWSLGLMVWECMGSGPFMSGFLFDENEVIADQVDALGSLPHEWWEKWETRTTVFTEEGQ